MKIKSLFLLAMLAGCATGWAASTETCLAVENGEWLKQSSFPDDMARSEYIWERWISSNSIFNNAEACFITENGNYTDFRLWRKVPYKIEWKCQEYRGMIWNEAAPCYREIGFREDGIVIWRRTDQALKDHEEREQRSHLYK